VDLDLDRTDLEILGERAIERDVRLHTGLWDNERFSSLIARQSDSRMQMSIRDQSDRSIIKAKDPLAR